MVKKVHDSSKILDKIQFHDSLNTVIWKNGKMRPAIRIRLLRAALEFYRFLELESLRVTDIIMTGSNAGFNYCAETSDIDLHLMVKCPRNMTVADAQNLFKTKKTLWEDEHNIHIGKFPIELYAEIDDDLVASGIYSVLKGKWLKTPSKTKPSINDDAVIAKVDYVASRIDDVLADKNTNVAEIKTLLDKIKHMRTVGLMDGGEFSVENLAFKALRSLGYLDRLWTLKTKIVDDSISLK